jgi:hypothetical protein
MGLQQAGSTMPTRSSARARPYAISASDSAAPLRALGRKGGARRNRRARGAGGWGEGGGGGGGITGAIIWPHLRRGHHARTRSAPRPPPRPCTQSTPARPSVPLPPAMDAGEARPCRNRRCLLAPPPPPCAQVGRVGTAGVGRSARTMRNRGAAPAMRYAWRLRCRCHRTCSTCLWCVAVAYLAERKS